MTAERFSGTGPTVRNIWDLQRRRTESIDRAGGDAAAVTATADHEEA
jgi:hypothetical protein